MENLIIYGAGGFGRETSLLLHQINLNSPRWNVIGYCDDGKSVGEKIGHLIVLGGMSYLNNYADGINVVIAIADPSTREKIRKGLINPKLKFPPIVHPATIIDTSCSIGEGCIICAGVIVTIDVSIKSFSIVNLSCTVGHDSQLSDFTSLMPAANISGNVSIGRGSYVGAGAILLQGISVGEYTVVGAGSVVTRSFENHKRIMGVPARSI